MADTLLLITNHISFAAVAANCNHGFFFFPAWWEYLKTSVDALGQCAPIFTFPDSLLAVGLAVLDMLVRLAGFVAVLSIIAAGAQHLFTDGNPEKAAAARRRLYNSIIGLAIAMTATALVTFIGNEVVK